MDEHECEHEEWDLLNRRLNAWRCRRCGDLIQLPPGETPLEQFHSSSLNTWPAAWQWQPQFFPRGVGSDTV
jgi:hypothetical protein